MQRAANLTTDDDDEAIRLTAYFLWEQDGRPAGREQDYWLRARERHARQRAYDGMLEENRPEDDRQSMASGPT